MPPVIPTTTSPLHNRENFVAGTGSYSSSFFGAMMWRIGATCCPCFGGPAASAAGESGGFFHAILRHFGKKMSSSHNGSTEGQQLIKRTKSEEEILKKRPQRKVKMDNNKSTESDVSTSSQVVPLPPTEESESKTNTQHSSSVAKPMEEMKHVKNGCSKVSVSDQQETDGAPNVSSNSTRPTRPSPRMVTTETRSKSMSKLAQPSKDL